MTHDSLYRRMYSAPRINSGYDVRRGLIRRFLSSRMFGNPMLSGFLERVDLTLVELTQAVKRLQFHFNFTIDRNDRSLNL